VVVVVVVEGGGVGIYLVDLAAVVDGLEEVARGAEGVGERGRGSGGGGRVVEERGEQADAAREVAADAAQGPSRLRERGDLGGHRRGGHGGGGEVWGGEKGQWKCNGEGRLRYAVAHFLCHAATQWCRPMRIQRLTTRSRGQNYHFGGLRNGI
jgi:hypothetical protein